MVDVATLQVRADTREVRTANDNLEQFNQTARRTSHAAQNTEQRMERVSRQFRRTAQAVSVLHGPLGGIASRFSSFASLVRNGGLVVAGFATSISALTFGAVAATRAFVEWEKQLAATEAVLRATNNASGLFVEDIERLTREIGLQTLASTQQVRAAANQLLTFRSIAQDTFERTLRLSQDLAQLGFGNIETSARQLGRALEDPARGLNNLRRIGVSFTEAQRQMIEELQETGRVAEAQTAILDILEQQVGGAGRGAAGGLAGAFDSATESIGFLLERFGQIIVQGTPVIEFFNRLAQGADNVAASIDRLSNVQQGATLQSELQQNTSRQLEIIRELSTLGDVATAPGARLRERLTRAGANEDRVRRLREELQLLQQRSGVIQRTVITQGQLNNLLDTEAQVAKEAAVQAERRRVHQDASEAAITGLEKEIELLEMGARSAAQYNAVREAGIDPTSKEADAIRELAGELFDLEQAQKGAAKSARDLQKAQDKAALAIFKLREQTRESIAEAEDWIATSFSDTLFDIATGADKASESLRKMALNIAEAVFQGAALGQGPLAGLLGFSTPGGGTSGGLIGGLINFLIPGGGPGVRAGVAHGGGRVSSTGMSRRVPASVFAGAPRLHDGLMPGEFPTILEQGETVLPRGSRQSSPQNNVQVRIVNESGGDSQIEDTGKRRTQTRGEVTYEDIIVRVVKRNLAAGNMDNEMRSRFNTRPIRSAGGF